jgi:uncharacterized protein YndB with AHSA1/START domain
MSVLLIILSAIAGVIVLLLIIAAFSKSSYSLEEQITINEPTDRVFKYVRYLKNQDRFNKWVMKDPNARRTYSGPDGETGFVMTWDSDDKQVGKGAQEITSISEGKRIDYEIRFEKPFRAISPSHLITEDAGTSRTTVRWGFAGKMPYPMNLFMLFIDIPSILRKDLRESLGNLKQILERNAVANSTPYVKSMSEN